MTVLAGAPKTGKSFFSLQLGLAVAQGDQFLGFGPVQAGHVLYLALEDGPRRLQHRLSRMGEGSPSGNLYFAVMVPRGMEVLTFIGNWLEDHPGARLVIVDVLGSVRSSSGAARSAYQEDYALVAGFRALAQQHGVAIVLVHHTRKEIDLADPFKEISGTTGLTGAATAWPS